MSLSFAELARLNAMDERIKALEAELKRRKGGRPKKGSKPPDIIAMYDTPPEAFDLAQILTAHGIRPKKGVLSPSEVNASARHVEGLLAGAGN